MLSVDKITQDLRRVFEERQAAAIARAVVEAVEEGQKNLVRARDFNELKDIVRELGVKVGELAEAQKRTEQKVEELAEAQKKTEEEIRKLARGLVDAKTELGGLARSVAYALENEAYRALPEYLKNYGIEITERFVRTEIGGEEINIFARGKKNGREVLIVGESELKLTSVSKKIKQLEKKAAVVQETFPTREIIKLIITHYARPAVMERAKEKGIIVVQSFEWL